MFSISPRRARSASSWETCDLGFDPHARADLEVAEPRFGADDPQRRNGAGLQAPAGSHHQSESQAAPRRSTHAPEMSIELLAAGGEPPLVRGAHTLRIPRVRGQPEPHQTLEHV